MPAAGAVDRGGVGEAERAVDVLARDEVAALDRGGAERHGVVGGAGLAAVAGRESSQATTATAATARRPGRRGRRGGRSGAARPCGRRRSLVLLGARAGSVAVAQEVVARLVGGLELRRVGTDPEARAAALAADAGGLRAGLDVSPPLPASFGSGMSTPVRAHAARDTSRAASWSLARLRGVERLAAADLHVLLARALRGLRSCGSLKLTLPPESLDARPSAHALRVGHVDAVLAHALGELQGAFEALSCPGRRRPAAAAVVGAAAGAERQGGADRGEEEW